jgi:hypothetical protein
VSTHHFLLDPAEFATDNGHITNLNQFDKVKQVFISPDKYSSVTEAEEALQIGRQHPLGPYAAPSHRVTVDVRGIELNYAGSVYGGTGSEIITYQPLPVIGKPVKLKGQ